jgi:hypothetical protein
MTSGSMGARDAFVVYMFINKLLFVHEDYIYGVRQIVFKIQDRWTSTKKSRCTKIGKNRLCAVKNTVSIGSSLCVFFFFTMADHHGAPNKATQQLQFVPSSTLLRAKAQSNTVFSPRKRRSCNHSDVDEVKRKLAKSTERCWLSTGAARVETVSNPKRDYYYVAFLKYQRKSDRRGKRIRSLNYGSALAAEAAIYIERDEKESKAGKEAVDAELLRKLHAMQGTGAHRQPEEAKSTPTAPSDDRKLPAVTASTRHKFRKKSFHWGQALSGNPRIRSITNMPDMNPSTPGYLNRYNTTLDPSTAFFREKAGTVLNTWLRNRLSHRARQNTERVLQNQVKREEIIKSLNVKIRSNAWRKLLVGCEDDEIAVTTTEHDRSWVIVQATHVCRALEIQCHAVTSDQSMIWRDCCNQAATEGKRVEASTIMEWFRLFNRGTMEDYSAERFPISQRGKSATFRLISPFDPEYGDERLTMKFKAWAREDLEKLPPICQPDAPKYDFILPEFTNTEVDKTSNELKDELKAKRLPYSGDKPTLITRAEANGIDVKKAVRKRNKDAGSTSVDKTIKDLQNDLREKELPTKGNKTELQTRANNCRINLKKLVVKKKEGYIGKPKGVIQMAWERGLCTRDQIKSKEVTVDGIRKDSAGNKVNEKERGKIDLKTSLRYLLGQCTDFKREITQLQYIASELGCTVIMTPKAHPELAGRGIEYAWGYSKLVFRRDNDAIAKNLIKNVLRAIRADGEDAPLNLIRIRKFARKARDYKVAYKSFFDAEANGDEEAKQLSYAKIEHQVKHIKTHRCALDLDKKFIRIS